MPLARHKSLVKPFEPSSWAAAALGPNTAKPASRSASATPATSGASGPITTRSIERLRASSVTARCVHGSTATHSAQRAIPGLPGAAISSLAAWRLPQAPGERIFAAARTQQQDVHGSPRRHASAGLLADVAARRQFAAADRQRAVGRAQADDRDRVRQGPRARRDFGLQAPRLGPLLFHAQGRCAPASTR